MNILNSVSSNINTLPNDTSSSQVESTPKVEKPVSDMSIAEFNKQNEEDIQQKLSKTVEDLNEQMDMLETNLKFGYNDKLNVMYVNVYEKSSGELVRKFPTEEAMKLAEHMKEFVGMLFDKKG